MVSVVTFQPTTKAEMYILICQTIKEKTAQFISALERMESRLVFSGFLCLKPVMNTLNSAIHLLLT